MTTLDLAEQIQKECINWANKDFDHNECVRLVDAYVAERVREAKVTERKGIFKFLNHVAKRDKWFIGGFLGQAYEELEKRK